VRAFRVRVLRPYRQMLSILVLTVAGRGVFSDVPGEQPGGDHGLWLRRRQDMAERALHGRVLACDVASREDGRHILSPGMGCVHVCMM
jgi:hypothetical protein